MSALIIGAFAAIFAYYCIVFRMKTGFDESLDVFACHGIGGIWGMLATGLFAEKAVNAAGVNGLFFGNPHQLAIQAFAIVVIGLFAFLMSFFIAKIIDAMFSLRVAEPAEDVGLDISQHGESVY
jgi:Amt family ammonium transporter